MKTSDLKQGKIYFIQYSGTSLIARFNKIDGTKIKYFSHLHYWAGYERYFSGGYSLTSGITEMREASDSEKHNLFKNEIANNDV